MLDRILTDELIYLNQIFTDSNFEIRIVGGAVRDILLGVTPKDIDLTTPATPDEMIEIAKKNNISYVSTGISHGTLSFILNHILYEITTLRIDKETDGRHATIAFTRSFEEDSKRRDLTYNSMSLDFDGNLYDYHHGQEDLENNIVRFVGNP